MPETFKNAVAAALVTAVLTIPLLGMQLQLEGYRVVLNTHWTPVLVAVLAVFLFQLARPALSRTSAGIKLPALPRMQPGQQRAAVLILLMAALVWPFFGSRGYVDV